MLKYGQHLTVAHEIRKLSKEMFFLENVCIISVSAAGDGQGMIPRFKDHHKLTQGSTRKTAAGSLGDEQVMLM